ncbi:MAG: hypothetical protein Q8O75_01930 [bacterium]|nr:hypothetical protein [bacterium]
MSILVESFFRKEKIILELDALGLEKAEKENLLKLSQEIAELRLLDAVLQRLEAKDKELFLEQLHSSSSEIVAEFLRDKIADIEDILEQHALVLENEIIEDIKNLR